MDKRGPKVGDAASLWNFTPSPGWTKEESLILKLCLMKYGIGQWIQIQATGLLPGKLIQQLNGATQRLLGQQSLAAFSGLKLDIDRIRADNEAKIEARRKNGLVIWDGPNPTKEMRLQWQQAAKEKYELTLEQLKEAEAALENIAAAAAAQVNCQTAVAAADALPPDLDILVCELDHLSLVQKQQLLCALHQRLQRIVSKAVQQHTSTAALVTYQQQPRQGWIALGIPLAAVPAPRTAAAVAGGAVSGSGSAAAAAGVASGGFDSDASDFKENQPCRANLIVRQAGTAAARKSKLSKNSNSSSINGIAGATGSKKQNGSRSQNSSKASNSKKRNRCTAADADDADFEDAYLQRRRSTSKRGSSKGDNGGSGDLLADIMKAALEAGVNQLVDMWYSRSKALDALKECNCDVELAVEYLTATCC